MSPAPHTYLDQKYDSSTELGLTWAGAVEVRDAYEWDPGAVIEGAHVLGVEAALWSETTETRDDVDYLVFPRLPAVAEVGWSASRDWERFRARLAAHGPLLEQRGVNFHRSAQIAWRD
jgi:hexosaminidase